MSLSKLQENLEIVSRVCQQRQGTVQVLANDQVSFVVDCAFPEQGHLDRTSATVDIERQIKTELSEADVTVIDRAHFPHQNHTYIRVQLREGY